MLKQLPKILIYSRLFIAGLILLFSIYPIPNYGLLATILISIGLLTDIFDGIIARHLGISTINLRRLDSIVDQIFWIAVAAGICIHCPNFFFEKWVSILILILIEAVAYLVSYLKFNKEIATHSIASKVWTLLMFATLVELILRCNSNTLFEVFFYVGLVSRLEIIAIILLLRNWTSDVPSFYHAVCLRQGRPIKRNKFFNG